ncbi:hormonally up-regulated neu tumor-associated kinase-like [Antedon mediterranea]|uniref:hormonally up-regulated neu tumor-associated kinase-like n=1 Tax=Antedon mediterranea TaxID=105859 RepID=UPI003AF41655
MYSSAIQHPRWEEVVKYSHTKRVGAYLIGRNIGEGSFAKVKEALHCTVVEKVAVKIIDKKHVEKDQYLKKNLHREAKLLQLIRHPNIVKLYEVLETDNYYYMAMELCSGGPLLNQLGKDKRMKETEVRHYVRQITSAVGYMHQAGIIHRDLKVENLLLDKNNNIKIIDFGLSNLISNLKPVVRDSGLCVYMGTQCGSPAYAAPEIIANRKYGPKVDVWSIGVNMFAMLSGTLPFVVEPFNLKLLLHRMLKGQMSEFPPNVSTECKSFILKLLEPNQVKRLSIYQVAAHEWLNKGYIEPLTIPPPAGRISRMDIDPDVTQYANEKLGLDIDHMTESVVRNKANHISAIYYLLLKKVEYKNACALLSRIPYSTKDFHELSIAERNVNSNVSGQNLVEEAVSEIYIGIKQHTVKSLEAEQSPL